MSGLDVAKDASLVPPAPRLYPTQRATLDAGRTLYQQLGRPITLAELANVLKIDPAVAGSRIRKLQRRNLCDVPFQRVPVHQSRLPAPEKVPYGTVPEGLDEVEQNVWRAGLTIQKGDPERPVWYVEIVELLPCFAYAAIRSAVRRLRGRGYCPFPKPPKGTPPLDRQRKPPTPAEIAEAKEQEIARRGQDTQAVAVAAPAPASKSAERRKRNTKVRRKRVETTDDMLAEWHAARRHRRRAARGKANAGRAVS
jgi:hypothetical protein